MSSICCLKPNLNEIRTVLIIGGGNGIGCCLTETLLNSTKDVVISCDIDLDSSLNVLHQQYASSRFNIYHVDVTRIGSIQTCLDNIKSLDNIECIDRVVICCGIFHGSPLLEMSDNAFISTFNVNVIGIWRMIQMLWTNQLLKYWDPMMLNENKNRNQNDNSRIIVISSETATNHVSPFCEPYGLSKSCLQNLCRTLKIELSTIGVDVITVNPGAVNTQLLEHMESRLARSGKDSPFRNACSLSIQCKDFVMRHSRVSEAQWIVDHALLWTIHGDRKWMKSEYYIGRTWASYVQKWIPRMMFDRIMICMFRFWNWYCGQNRNNDKHLD